MRWHPQEVGASAPIGLGSRVHDLHHRDLLAVPSAHWPNHVTSPELAALVLVHDRGTAFTDQPLRAEALDHDPSHLGVPLPIDQLHGQTSRLPNEPFGDDHAVVRPDGVPVRVRDGRTVAGVRPTLLVEAEDEWSVRDDDLVADHGRRAGRRPQL